MIGVMWNVQCSWSRRSEKWDQATNMTIYAHVEIEKLEIGKLEIRESQRLKLCVLKSHESNFDGSRCFVGFHNFETLGVFKPVELSSLFVFCQRSMEHVLSGMGKNCPRLSRLPCYAEHGKFN